MEQKTIFKSIPVGQAKTILEQEKNVLLIDARTKEEYDTWHIENAVLVPHTLIMEGIERLNPPKEQTILVICKGGGRSSCVAEKLAEIGYQNVYNIEGGYIAWNKLLLTRKEISQTEFDKHRMDLSD